MMSVRGVGAVAALTFVAAIDDPKRFGRPSDVGDYLGLTPKRYQSGEVDICGRIFKAGDRLMRSLLFEAANTLMTRVKTDSALRRWGLGMMAGVAPRRQRLLSRGSLR